MKATHEHEFEAQLGLPEKLPEGETILWQGAPDWITLAIEAFHIRSLSIYFGIMLIFQINYLADQSEKINISSVALSATLVSFILVAITIWAWMTAKASMYTITNKRVVMRIGLVFSLTFNLPLKKILGANELKKRNKTVDLSLVLNSEDRIAWLHLWPHARPWRIDQPEPSLRCLKDGHECAEILKKAWVIENKEIAEYSNQSIRIGNSQNNSKNAFNASKKTNEEAYLNRAMQS
jgi:hypothetical protein